MDEDVDIKIPNRDGGPLVFGTIQRGDAAAAVAAGEAAGNIFRQTADAEVLDLPEVGGQKPVGSGRTRCGLDMLWARQQLSTRLRPWLSTAWYSSRPLCIACAPAVGQRWLALGALSFRSPRASVPWLVALQASAEHARKQQELMREIELRRKMKATVVPTNDGEVRRMLRQLGEPVTLFGEREVRGDVTGRCCGPRLCVDGEAVARHVCGLLCSARPQEGRAPAGVPHAMPALPTPGACVRCSPWPADGAARPPETAGGTHGRGCCGGGTGPAHGGGDGGGRGSRRRPRQ